MALADHLGIQPATIASAILTALSAFKRTDEGGIVNTLKLYAGNEFNPELVDRQMTAGAPGWLVAVLGGEFIPEGASGKRFRQTVHVHIVCAAGTYLGLTSRLQDQAETLTVPGVEDLLDLATYYGTRALDSLAVSQPRPVRHTWLRVEPGKYLAVAELECIRRLDLWEDDPTTILESLGIVHDPLDPNDPWESDNLTPKSEWPPTVDGGVTEL